MDMGKTNERNLREDESLAEVVKNTNVCMIKVFRFAPFSSHPLNIARTHCFLGFLYCCYDQSMPSVSIS